MTTTARHTAPEPPSVGGMLAAIDPLIGVVAVAGPPALIAGGALVFGVLLLAGPFVVIVTLVAGLALVALLAAAVAAIVASPYLLFRYVRAHGPELNAAAPIVIRREPVT